MEKKKINITYVLLYLFLLIFFAVFFNIVGIRVIIGLSLIVLPFALFLKHFELPVEEVAIYSLFLALVFFPVFVYYAGIMAGSIRLAIIIVFAIIFLFGVIIKLKGVNKGENKS